MVCQVGWGNDHSQNVCVAARLPVRKFSSQILGSQIQIAVRKVGAPSGRFGRAVGVGCDLRRRLLPVGAIYVNDVMPPTDTPQVCLDGGLRQLPLSWPFMQV